MRPLLGLCLFACVLGVGGCNLPKRLKGDSSRGAGTGQPFLGSPTGDPSDPAPVAPDSPSDTLASKQSVTRGKGVFAGQVRDSAGRRVPAATIKISEVEPAREKDGAPLTVETKTDKQGWFEVGGLDPGRYYRLVARARDGNRYLIGSTRAQASNVRVVIALTGEEPAGGSEKAEEKTGSQDKSAAPASASIGTPIILKPNPPAPAPSGTTTPLEPDDFRPAQPPPPPAKAPPPVPPPDDPSLLANERERKEGFERRHDPVPATIPGPGRNEPQRKPLTPAAPYAPPPPPISDDDRHLGPSTAPSAAPAARPPAEQDKPAEEDMVPTKLVVPSCVRIGQRVENFALFDYDGNVWELKKKRRGRLVLLDFWYSTCGPCLHAIPYLTKLDRNYRSFGLDVVGIAHEKGATPPEKQEAVRPVRTRHNIQYPILFTGGGTVPNCPVLRQFEIHEYPTLVLLDEKGKIVWRGSGLNERTKYDLEMDIRRRLGLSR